MILAFDDAIRPILMTGVIRSPFSPFTRFLFYNVNFEDRAKVCELLILSSIDPIDFWYLEIGIGGRLITIKPECIDVLFVKEYYLIYFN